MKIIWLINVALPEASFLLNERPSPFGGWLINASSKLARKKDIDLSIIFPNKGTKGLKKLKGNNVTYYPFDPISEKNQEKIENNTFFEKILDIENPNIVHIFGTEFAHTLSMINICKRKRIETVISIQGLVSIYAKHYYANLPFNVVYGVTFRDMVRKDNVYFGKKRFEKRGKNEVRALKLTNHIIGRTTWDRACSLQINETGNYHFCNEILREGFYKHVWDINKCEPNSIFLSQSSYPIKGLHYVLEALPIVLKRFPETKLYISGIDITKNNTLKRKLSMSYYGKYISKLINNNNLYNNVIFTGPLAEEEMIKLYLNSNVFVCPSSIENSPNSLGEAMILGVPSIASDVGGVSDMLVHGEEGFIYQTDAPYMLAHYICEIFDKKDLAVKFSKNARSHALITHSEKINTDRLLEIYQNINEKT